MRPRVIFEDEHILVLDKPPYLVVDPAESVKEETLADILKKEFGIELFRGGIVHRLDKDTSGVIIVAKTQQALENLQNQFKERETKKEYLALVHGLITENVTVAGNIGRNPGNREKFIVLEGGKEAETEFEPVSNFQFSIHNLNAKSGKTTLQKIFNEFNKIQMRKLERQRYNEFTLVRAKPKTGRTHQIRVHLKYISHPVVSDEKYAGRKIVRLDKRWCQRIFLHAAKLGFKHPASGSWMELESKLPGDLKEALDKLEIRN